MAVFFLLGFVLGIILGVLLYRAIMSILLRKRTKRDMEELAAYYYRPVDIGTYRLRESHNGVVDWQGDKGNI